MKPAAIDLQIDELVLHGFAPHDRSRIGAAVERELGRLLGEAAAPGGTLPPSLTASRAAPAVEVGAVHVTPGASPAVVGRQVARAVYQGLAGATRRAGGSGS